MDSSELLNSRSAHSNATWKSGSQVSCVVVTTCVSECTLYRPIVIQPLRHRAGPRTDCETDGAS